MNESYTTSEIERKKERSRMKGRERERKNQRKKETDGKWQRAGSEKCEFQMKEEETLSLSEGRVKETVKEKREREKIESGEAGGTL